MIFLIQIGIGIGRLYELREKLVIDDVTSLMWQQSGSTNSMVYANAEKYIRELNDQRFAGYNDWRLPTLEEAMSLMAPKHHTVFCCDLVFDRKQSQIWTADKESAERAWGVHFDYGYCYPYVIANDYFVRAVRS